MMDQGKSSLATQGVTIQVPKIDLFQPIPTSATEESYADQLLNNQASSPFNIFEQ